MNIRLPMPKKMAQWLFECSTLITVAGAVKEWLNISATLFPFNFCFAIKQKT